MPLKHDQVEMFLFPALVSALATIIFLSMQQVSALGCDESSCDSLVKIDGINIGKIGDDKKLNTEDINKILDEDKKKLENVQGANDGVNGVNNDGVNGVNNDGVNGVNNDGVNGVNNGDDNNKIKIKDLNVLIDDDDKKPQVKSLPNNATVVKIKDFKILIPK
jgi:hypothetical protein